MEERADHERTLAAAERAHIAAVRALADRKAGLATLAGKAEALRSGAAATADEIDRLSEALAEAQERAAAAHAELEDARAELGETGEGDPGARPAVRAAPARRPRPPAPASPSWSPGSASWSSSARTGGPASTRCRSGWPARTAPPPSPTPRACSARCRA